MRLIVRNQCPSCGGSIPDERLSMGLPCEKCLQDIDLRILEIAQKDRLHFLREICGYISCSEGQNKFRELLHEEEFVQEFSEFFRNTIGNPPWSAQITWAKRVFKGKSFTILAPTGVGKSLFGIIMALYLATKGKKCYLVQPTSLLVKQTSDRLTTYARKLGLNVKTIAYIVKGEKEKTEVINRIAKGDYEILVTTSQFLSRNFELIKNIRFDFIFVDDVDSIIKSSKNVDKLLLLLGLPQDAINIANKIVRLTVNKSKFSEDKLHVLNDARRRLKELISNGKTGVLVVSTATGRPKGLRVKLFRELLGFEIGSRTELLRNVVDSYLLVSEGDFEKHIAEVASKLGKGGLIFIQPGISDERIGELLKHLAEKGIKAELVTSKSKEAFSRFEKGELDVLIGYATYYGLLVRGIDLPHIIRYAIFAGTPHFKFAAEVEEASPLRLLQIAQALRNVISGSEAARLDRLTISLRRRLRDLELQSFRALSEALNTGKSPEGFLSQVYNQVLELRVILKELISRSEVLKAMEARAIASIRLVDDRPFLLIPDAPTYLQATGRTSRMFAGGISKGLSVVITDDEKLLEALQKQVRWYTDESTWVRFEELDLNTILSEVDKDREFIKSLINGEVKPEVADMVKTALVVVESPTKARTIASFFG
ncbi:MAG: reverse gyrase, partial [Thermofilaceae archaeon]